eukprot:COSAG01_NODE_50525_length_362_cov_2.543726_1_plen_44_part_10
MPQKLKKHMCDEERSVDVADWRVCYTLEDARESVTVQTVCLWLR